MKRYKIKNNNWRTDGIHLYVTLTETDGDGIEHISEIEVPFQPSDELMALWYKESRLAVIALNGDGNFDSDQQYDGVLQMRNAAKAALAQSSDQLATQ